MTQACDLSAVEARRLIGQKKLSPLELLESCVKRIETVNPKLNALVAMDIDLARQQAKADEQAVMNGDNLEILHGLPVAIKDLTAVKNMRFTQGSLLYEDYIPDEDDPIVNNIRASGGNVFAKSNTPEFGAGANTTNRVYGVTCNPFDSEKTCAGSSGGAAVSLATGMVPLATGSDYGGSLRTPASFCGISGFRPSPGLVPVAQRAVSLNPFSVEGPMGRSVADAHLLLQAQLDVDNRDPYSSDDAFTIPQELVETDLASLQVAFSADMGCAPIDKQIAKVFEGKVGHFSHLFNECIEAHPDMSGVHEAFEVLRGVNFVAAHRERLDAHRDKLGANVIDNTERGLGYSLGDVAHAHNLQSALYYRFLRFFDEFDVLICPAASVSPFLHSELYVREINGETMPTYMRWLTMTYAPTMALACACVIPCGRDHLGMPFGIQIIGSKGMDAKILQIAYTLEKAFGLAHETARPVPDTNISGD